MAHPWLTFGVLVGALLVMDLAVLQRPGRPVSVRGAWLWTAFLAALACGFALYIGRSSGRQPALEFLTGYVIEGSLSIDNLFVFLILFRALHLGAEQQRRVLLWGVLGAIVLRGVLILAGTALLRHFGWVQEAFGALLAFAAVRLLLHKPAAGPVRGPIRWIRDCCLRLAPGEQLALTSLLLVIAAVEVTDLLFALDSIPAVLGVSHDPFVVYTSNIAAILGLRSLYFALAELLDRFRYLHYGLGALLGFVALKMLAAPWFDLPITVSLAIIGGILAVCAVASAMAGKPPAVEAK